MPPPPEPYGGPWALQKMPGGQRQLQELKQGELQEHYGRVGAKGLEKGGLPSCKCICCSYCKLLACLSAYTATHSQTQMQKGESKTGE